jgi:hypothetical protein
MKIKNLFLSSILMLSSTLFAKDLKVGDITKTLTVDHAMFLFNIKDTPKCPNEKTIYKKEVDDIKMEYKLINKVDKFNSNVKEITTIVPIKKHYIIRKIIKICRNSDETFKINVNFEKEWKKNLKKDKK